MSNESYDKSPAETLVKRLKAASWESRRGGLWEKGRHRIYVDGISIFLYRLLNAHGSGLMA